MSAKNSQLKCNGCGGAYKFEPKSFSLVCKNCGSSIALEKRAAKAQKYEDALVAEQSKKWDEFSTSFQCSSCGARQTVGSGSLMDRCAFCDSPSIQATSNDENGTLPNCVLPFMYDEQQAKDFIMERVKRNRWAPKRLLQKIELDKIKGVYSPSYAYSFTVTGSYNGRLGREDTTIVKNFTNSGYAEKSDTKWFNVSGTINQTFNDIITSAGQTISDVVIRQLEPFNVSAAASFDQGYLCGYIANQSGLKIATGRERAEQIARNRLTEIIKQKHNAHTVSTLDLQLNFSNVMFKYTLLPIYATKFEYAGNTYNQYVNGYSGATVGKLPKSRAKIFFATFFTLALLGVGAFLIYYFT